MIVFDTQRFLDNVLSALPGPVSYMDRDLKYHYANQAYVDWFGVSRESCLNHRMPDILGEAVVTSVRPFLDAAYAGTPQTFERILPYKDLGPRLVRVQYLPDKDARGEVVGLIVIVQSVVAEQNLVNLLAESQNYFRHVLDSSQHGIWGLNTRGELNFINRRAVALLGYDREDELIGRPMHDLVHYQFGDGRPHPKSLCPMYDSFVNQNTHHVTDDVLWRKDGTSFPVSYYSTPVMVNDVCVGSVVTFEDITQRRALEAAVEVERVKSVRNAKLASLGEMSAGVAHEINNPLAIITGTVGLLADLVDRPDVLRAKIETIKKSCGRIARIVKGLQKFSRTGAKSTHQPHAVTKLVQEALVLTESKSKPHFVAVTLEGDSTAEIQCDEIEIEQVLINLINNAIDAVKTLDEKWVKVSIHDDGPSVVVRVTDSGAGIPAPVRERLFEPFFTTKEIGQGTGLGLSITKGILDEHKATITVKADAPHTCFELTFPRAAGAVRAG